MTNTSNSPRHGSDATDLEALFANGFDPQTANQITTQRYVTYMCQRYADQNIEDYSLWNAIQIDFGDFMEEKFNKLDGPIWTLLRDYCYKHGFRIDYNFGHVPRLC